MSKFNVLLGYVLDFISCLFFNKQIDEYPNRDKVYITCVNSKYEIHIHSFDLDTVFTLESKQFESFFSAARHYLKQKKVGEYNFLMEG